MKAEGNTKKASPPQALRSIRFCADFGPVQTPARLARIDPELPHPVQRRSRQGQADLAVIRSVQAALVDSFREAKVKQDRTPGDQLIFLAGVKKLQNTFRAFRKVGFHDAIPFGDLLCAKSPPGQGFAQYAAIADECRNWD